MKTNAFNSYPLNQLASQNQKAGPLSSLNTQKETKYTSHTNNHTQASPFGSLNNTSLTHRKRAYEKPKSVYISTYGCQMNVNDTERMYSVLEMLNYVPAHSPDQASMIIINSCSVREKPVHKVRSEAGRYHLLKQKNPKLKIGVAGCVAQQEKKRLLKDIPIVDFVFGPDAIDDLPHIVSRVEKGEKSVSQTRFTHSEPYHIQTLLRNPEVSAFVNIMKGCDNFCTFCVVPFTRGRERSHAGR